MFFASEEELHNWFLQFGILRWLDRPMLLSLRMAGEQ